jgi:hypothetical protein
MTNNVEARVAERIIEAQKRLDVLRAELQYLVERIDTIESRSLGLNSASGGWAKRAVRTLAEQSEP